jgi:lipid-A-disaccharide synthase
VQVSKYFPEYECVVAGMSIHGASYYEKLLKGSNCKLLMDAPYQVLKMARAALVTSGTATIETALLNVPQVVCYKGSWLSYLIGRMLVKVPFISMVNLVCNKMVVAELIQHEANVERTKNELQKILQPDVRQSMLSDYQLLKQKLGGKGASRRAAEAILKTIHL